MPDDAAKLAGGLRRSGESRHQGDLRQSGGHGSMDRRSLNHFSPGLAAALRPLVQILPTVKPRFVLSRRAHGDGSEGRKREEEQDRYEEFDGRLFWTRIKTCSDISHNGTM